MFAAWEIGVWTVLREHFTFDLVVGASAGSWNGWGIAAGQTPDDMEHEWLDPTTASIMQLGLNRYGCLRPDGLRARARKFFDGPSPRIPFGLTLTEVPRLRLHLFRNDEITADHLTAACAIPLCFPPVEIGGRKYVDGGLLGALPVWAAEEMGATRAIALNCLTTLPFRMLKAIVRPRQATSRLHVDVIEPSKPLGSLWAAMAWSPENIRRWLDLGRQDGIRALTSITM
jgi:NTE family protein